MTTLTEPRPTTTHRRLPVPALAAGLLVLLMGAIGGYGAIYFTGLEGWDSMGYTYVTTYECVAVTGLLSAAALLSGRRIGLIGVAWYAAFQIAFTTCKLIVVHETEAIPFGVASLVVLALATRPSARAGLR